VPQVIVVDQILVAERKAEYPLADQRRDLMLDELLQAEVLKARGEPMHQTNRPIGGPNSSAPASEVIVLPSKEATTSRPATGAKPNRSEVHSVGIGELRRIRKSRCGTTTFSHSVPRCTSIR
jgi:hypothetical protein